MSDETRQVEEPSISSRSVLDLLDDWYHVPVLGVILAFMLWVRVQSFGNFVRGGTVYFSGNDPWYHFRQVVYTVENWPRVMPFDPWTQFPLGTSSGQFGTLYDQLMATAALVVGLGDPSTNTIATVTAITPAVFGAAAALPAYFIAKRLVGRFGGVFAALTLALLPGLFLRRGLVGTADHNIAEPFFQATAVLALMVAVGVAERDRPIYEQVVGREFASLRRPLGWSVLAGVAVALYLWVWPPGVILVAIFGAFLVIKLSADYLRGTSPDHVAFAGATSMVVAGLLSFIPLSEPAFRPVSPSLVQPAVAFAVAAGAAFMAWLGREWEARDANPQLYPLAVLGLMVAGLVVIRVALPGLFQTLVGNLDRVFFFLPQGAGTGTIAEAQPWFQRAGPNVPWFVVVFVDYGLTFFTALAGAAVMVARSYTADDHDGGKLLVLVWFLVVTSMTMTQVRFNYYLAVAVAVLNGYLIAWIVGVVDLDAAADRLENVELYQVLAVVAAVLLVLAPLVAPVGLSAAGQQVTVDSATSIGSSAGPGQAIVNWGETLNWMQNNTPEEGTYGGADNEMEYYGTYAKTDDFDYPEGAYGVMSWWDYGHWITVEGERIPNANPFQQQAIEAANFLLAPNETAAEETMAELSEDDAETRYVMVDWKMVAPDSKFGAPTVFYDRDPNLSTSDMFDRVFQVSGQNVQVRMYPKTQRYYESQMIRLYRYHGSAMEPRPIVVDWDPLQTNQGTFKQTPRGNNSAIRQFDTMAEARAFVRNDTTSQIGGFGRFPSEYVPALQHYRVVKVSQATAPQRYVLFGRIRNVPSWVKLFERVPGATVEGQGPPNQTVTAAVRMQVPTQNTTFTYTQRAETGSDGSFEMTLPYSTTGYEEMGVDAGYTNLSVRAVGPYQFRTDPQTTGPQNLTVVTYNATTHVSEAKVVGEDESPVQVELQRQEDRPGGAPTTNNSTATGATANNSSTTGNATNGSSLVGPGLPAIAGGDAADLAPAGSPARSPDAAVTPAAEPLAAAVATRG